MVWISFSDAKLNISSGGLLLPGHTVTLYLVAGET